jgi:rhodanese-related sulfurtransferase
MMVDSISPAELKARLAANDGAKPLLLDVREPHEYSYCRIEHSINIPLGEIIRRAGELDQERETVVICHHGRRSLQAAIFLEQNGFSSVINLTGGIEAWAVEVDPAMPRY